MASLGGGRADPRLRLRKSSLFPCGIRLVRRTHHLSQISGTGKGIGKALYDALEAILDAQGYCLLYSLVCGENENSMRFHEKRGYRTVAHFPACGFKFGRWLDLNWMEKRLKGVDTPGGVPVPWQAVMQNAEFIHQYLDNFSLS